MKQALKKVEELEENMKSLADWFGMNRSFARAVPEGPVAFPFVFSLFFFLVYSFASP